MSGAVRAGVLVTGDVATVQVHQEEGEAADQDARRAEVVAGSVAAPLVHVTCGRLGRSSKAKISVLNGLLIAKYF